MRLLTLLLATTAVLAIYRVVAPVARGYADETDIPAARVWGWLAVTAAASAVGLLYVLNVLTR